MRSKGKGCAGLSPVRVVGGELAHLFVPGPGMPCFRPRPPQPSGGSLYREARLSGRWRGAGAASPPGAPRGQRARLSLATAEAEHGSQQNSVPRARSARDRRVGREGQERAGFGRGRDREAGRARGLAAGSVHSPSGRRPAPLRRAARRVHVSLPHPAPRRRGPHVGVACARRWRPVAAPCFPSLLPVFVFLAKGFFSPRAGSDWAL